LFNTADGWQALSSNITGGSNTAIGAGALFSNTGDGNTATGLGALLSNTTASDNTAHGSFALFFWLQRAEPTRRLELAPSLPTAPATITRRSVLTRLRAIPPAA
jgi:hypothetical protein